MCGIFGTIGTTPLTQRILPVLACYMDERGRDSWGVTDGSFIWKEKGEIVNAPIAEFDLQSPVFHTRHATVGAPTERNAHPFEVISGDHRVVGVHNGAIRNHLELKAIYHRDDAEVDSEHIFRHLAEGKPVDDIKGWGAVVWYEQTGDGPIQEFHSRFGFADLALAKLKSGEIVFASTQRSVEIATRLAGGAIDKFYVTKPNVKYIFSEGELQEVGPMQWGPLEYPRPAYAGRYSRPVDRIPRLDKRDLCAKMGCNSVVDNKFICEACLLKIKQDYGFIQPTGVVEFDGSMYVGY